MKFNYCVLCCVATLSAFGCEQRTENVKPASGSVVSSNPSTRLNTFLEKAKLGDTGAFTDLKQHSHEMITELTDLPVMKMTEDEFSAMTPGEKRDIQEKAISVANSMKGFARALLKDDKSGILSEAEKVKILEDLTTTVDQQKRLKLLEEVNGALKNMLAEKQGGK